MQPKRILTLLLILSLVCTIFAACNPDGTLGRDKEKQTLKDFLEGDWEALVSASDLLNRSLKYELKLRLRLSFRKGNYTIQLDREAAREAAETLLAEESFVESVFNMLMEEFEAARQAGTVDTEERLDEYIDELADATDHSGEYEVEGDRLVLDGEETDCRHEDDSLILDMGEYELVATPVEDESPQSEEPTPEPDSALGTPVELTEESVMGTSVCETRLSDLTDATVPRDLQVKLTLILMDGEIILMLDRETILEQLNQIITDSDQLADTVRELDDDMAQFPGSGKGFYIFLEGYYRVADGLLFVNGAEFPFARYEKDGVLYTTLEWNGTSFVFEQQ